MLTSRTVSYAEQPSLTELKHYLRLGAVDTSLNNVLLGLLTQAQGVLEGQFGYVVGTGSYTETIDAESGKWYRLSRAPVNAVSSVAIDGVAVGYETQDDFMYGVKWICPSASGEIDITYTTQTPEVLPANVIDALDVVIYDRFVNEPPYEVTMDEYMNQTPLAKRIFA